MPRAPSALPGVWHLQMAELHSMSDASSPPPVRLERIPAYRFHPALPLQACKNLNMNQAERRAADADTAGKIDAFIQVRLCGHCVPALDCSQWFWCRWSLALPFTQLTVPRLPDRSLRSVRRGSTPSPLRLRTPRATRSLAAQTAAPPVSDICWWTGGAGAVSLCLQAVQ